MDCNNLLFARTVRGAFSYVDPRNQVRTVEYVADQNGFYPQLSHPVQNTKAVDLATQRHFELYNKIAERNSDPNYTNSLSGPKDSAAVGKFQASRKSLIVTHFFIHSVRKGKALDFVREDCCRARPIGRRTVGTAIGF